MIAIIFAAGIGSRLKPFTDHHPKALAEVAGKPAIAHAIDKILGSGIERIIINVHHFADQIEACVRTNYPQADISFSDERALLLDTGGALAKISRECLEGYTGPVLVHNADIVTDFPLAPMIEAHEHTGADATILVDPERQSTRRFMFDADNRLHGWVNLTTGATRPDGFSPDDYAPASFGGMHIISHNTLKDIDRYCGVELKPFSITNYYLDRCQQLNICGYTPAKPFRWHDIGNPAKLAAAQADFA